MTTLSVLKDIKELEDVKIRLLPIPSQRKLHPDIDWLRNEYSKWSKKYPGFNPKIDYLMTIVTGLEHSGCKSKERLLNITTAMDLTFNIDNHLLPARKERSASKAQEVAEGLLRALKAGKYDESFTPAKRFAEGLYSMKRELNKQQWSIVEMLLELTIKAHLDIHCNYWLKNRFLSFDEYLDKRTPESFWPYLIFLSEYSVDYPIGADIRYNKLFKTLTEKLIEWGLSVDDYYMAKIKIMSNDITTRIICLLNEKGCSLQEAFDNQFEYSMDLYKQCIELRDKINASHDIASDKLSAWMDTAFNNMYVLLMIFEESQQMEEKSNQIVGSPKWDQVYRELISNTKSTVDPWHIE